MVNILTWKVEGCFLEMGKVLRTASDPPGQRSVYVNPGTLLVLQYNDALNPWFSNCASARRPGASF